MEIHKLLKNKGIIYKHFGSGTKYWNYGLVYKDDINKYPSYKELIELLVPNFIFSAEHRYPIIYAIDWDKHEEKDIIKCDLEICHISNDGYVIDFYNPCYFSAWAGPAYGVTNYRLYGDLNELKNECIY